MRSLAYAKRYKTRPVVLFISLEGLEADCGALGSRTFDSLLKEFTKRLLKFKRESDTLARLDERLFGLILENIDETNAVTVVARRISNSISLPIEMYEQKYHLSPYITLCTDLEIYSQSEIEDIRRFYTFGKEIVLSDEKVHLALS